MKRKYNGVELEEALGLDLYEMDFRQYDPAIARFTGIDPVTHHSMSTYTAFDNNPVFWADPSGADSETFFKSKFVNQMTGGHWIDSYKNDNNNDLVKNNSDDKTTDIDISGIREGIMQEFNLNQSSSRGEAIVNTFLSSIILKVYLAAAIEISLNSKRPMRNITYFPSHVARSRNTQGRNSLLENRDYGTVEFSDDFRVTNVNEGVGSGGDYGYMYSSGSSITYNTLSSDNLLYNDYNSYGDNTFDGYAYIDFKSSDEIPGKRVQVGRLMFRTEKIKEEFENYFEIILKAEIKKRLLEKK